MKKIKNLRWWLGAVLILIVMAARAETPVATESAADMTRPSIQVEPTGDFVFRIYPALKHVAVKPHGRLWKLTITLPKHEALEAIGIVPGDHIRLPKVEGLARIMDVRKTWRTVQLELALPGPYVFPEEGSFQVTLWKELGDRLLEDMHDNVTGSTKQYAATLKHILRTMWYSMTAIRDPLDPESPSMQFYTRLYARVSMYIFQGQSRQLHIPDMLKHHYQLVFGQAWPVYTAFHFINTGSVPLRIRQVADAESMRLLKTIVWEDGSISGSTDLAPFQQIIGLLPAERPVLLEYLPVDEAAEETYGTRFAQALSPRAGENAMVLLRLVEQESPVQAVISYFWNETPFDLYLFARPDPDLQVSGTMGPRRGLTLCMVAQPDQAAALQVAINETLPEKSKLYDLEWTDGANGIHIKAKRKPPEPAVKKQKPVVEKSSVGTKKDRAERKKKVDAAPPLEGPLVIEFEEPAESGISAPAPAPAVVEEAKAAPPAAPAPKKQKPIILSNTGDIPLTVHVKWGGGKEDWDAVRTLPAKRKIKIPAEDGVLTLFYSPVHYNTKFYRRVTKTIEEPPPKRTIEIQASVKNNAVEALSTILTGEGHDLQADISAFDFWETVAWVKATCDELQKQIPALNKKAEDYPARLQEAASAFVNLRRAAAVVAHNKRWTSADLPPGILDTRWLDSFLAMARNNGRMPELEKTYARLRARIIAEKNLETPLNDSKDFRTFMQQGQPAAKGE